ncbi:MAG: hypothetical protein ABI333_29675 [bacterium]
MTDDPKRRGVDALVEQLRADGHEVSDGEFTLDRAVAREKLRQFQLADPWSYCLELVQAAVLKGASKIDLEVERTRLRMRFDGRPFGRVDFEELYGAMFSKQDDVEIHARRQLAVAVNAAQALAPRRIHIVSGDGESATELELRPGEDDRIESLDGVSWTEVQVEYGALPEGTPHASSRREGARHTAELIRERCRYARIEVRLNDEVISTGFTLPEAVASVEIQEPNQQGVCACLPAVVTGQVRFVRNGVWMGTHEHDALAKSTVAVIEDPRLRMDLTHSAVIRDDAFDEALAAAQQAAEQLAGRLRRDWVTLGVFGADKSSAYSSTGGLAPKESPLELDRFYLSVDHSGLIGVFYALKRFMRLLVVMMYLSPLLIAPKLVLWILDNPAGDWITVGFVGLVLLFFLVLVILGALYMLVGPPDKRKAHLETHLGSHDVQDALRLLLPRGRQVEPTSRPVLESQLNKSNPKQQLRLRGRVRAFETSPGQDRAVVRDVWLARQGRVARLSSIQAFWLELDGPPVVVAPQHPPWIVAEYEQGGGPGLEPQLRASLEARLQGASKRSLKLDELLTDGTGVTIEDGDEVELISLIGGTRLADLRHITLVGHRLTVPPPESATGVRSAKQGRWQGLLVEGSAKTPLVIRKL